METQNHKIIYAHPYYKVRRLCHAVKTGMSDACKVAARELMEICPDDAVIIPMPSHEGKSTYTLKIAKYLSVLRDDVTIEDILSGDTRETLYNARLKGKDLSEINLGIALKYKKHLGGRPVVLLDNVVSSGKTFTDACNVLKPLQIDPQILVIGFVDKESIRRLGYDRRDFYSLKRS